ncbi:UDP-glucosyltransferase 2-like [Schistocerca nitens]|uniref:UDP-glucosyltransferase 2-like n=1 Tax=Schistocerca nitens TaxID=7011 RepID=UPI00211807F4|nr:UDP-glucosyltransferase 2-like [Schistocerca nitens]
MEVHIQLVALVACLAAGSGDAARILALFHYPGGSHFNTLGRLVRELAARGHHLTVVSHVPLDSPPANYTDVSIRGSAPLVTDTFSVKRLLYTAKKDLGLLDLGITREIASYLFNIDFKNCKVAYEHPAVEDLIRSIRSGEKQFDLVIVHALTIDCFDPFAHLLGGVPLVAVSTNMMTPWCSDRVANPHNPAYVGTYFLPYETANMGFYERFLNTVYHLFVKFVSSVVGRYCRPSASSYWPSTCADKTVRDLYEDQFLIRQSSGNKVRHRALYEDTEELHRRHLGTQLPPLWQSLSATSLVLLNTHWTIGGAVPLLPNVVEVGGLHIEQPQPLPQELEQFLSGSAHGAVYVSFGSLIAFHTLPLDKMRAVLEALSSLEQRVVLRCDASQLPAGVRLPGNVWASRWLPQTAILAHVSVHAFVTHGGMHSVLEAIHFGVPLLGFPLFGDQKLTMNRLQTLGVAIQQDYLHLTAQSFRVALRSLVNDTRYRERAKQLSQLFWDRPRPPLEEAVYWVEYVIRHRGAPHLRSAALDLSWYQYLLLDVAAFVGLGAVLAGTLLCVCLKSIYTDVWSTVDNLKRA